MSKPRLFITITTAALAASLSVASAQQQKPPALVQAEQSLSGDKTSLETALRHLGDSMSVYWSTLQYEQDEVRWMGCISDDKCVEWMRTFVKKPAETAPVVGSK